MTRVPREWTHGPELAYPELTFPELVLVQAARRPDAVAVRQWDERVTYAELVDRATRLAERLRDLGVGPEVPVAMCLRRRPEAVVAMLGVMLAGGVHLPLELDHPSRRLREIVADAGVRVAMGDAEGRELLGDAVPEFLAVPDAPASPTVPAVSASPTVPAVSASPTVPAVSASPTVPSGPCAAGLDGAAYIIYTSGSTGRPKGVVVTHRSLTAYLTGLAHTFGIGEDVVSVCFSSFGFDAFVGDLLLPLALGGQATLLGEADRADPQRAQRFVAAHGATFGILTVALLPVLDPAAMPGWTTVLAGGEEMPRDQVARWSAGRRFVNVYGPTETTVTVTHIEVSGEWTEPVPIGRPFPNHRAYVVDADLTELPPGASGELVIGGPGVTRGYLGRPELTAERFVNLPTGERVYRTGDLASWRPDGTLAFHGRIDRQVKIRGQRLEIGEVEAVLRRHPGVAHAAVDTVDTPRGKELVAAVAPLDEVEPDELRGFCSERLPAFMVPARIVRVAALPITSAGKLDQAALREMTRPDPRSSTVDSVADPLASAVYRAWTAILGSQSAALDDDFFGQGGHSIAAMRLAVRLRADLDRAVAVEDVFAGRTLGGLIERVAAAPHADGALVTGAAPGLSPAQRRLWFLDRLAPDSTAYNVPLAQRLRGPLDVPALRAAVRIVVERHDVLRWRMPHDRGEPYAVVGPGADVALEPVALPAVDLAGALAAFAREPFDLSTGPLWRARLFRLGPDDHVFALSVHHCVFDGWSQAPLYRELAAAYAPAAAGSPDPLAPLPATYADYVAWRAERDQRRGDSDLAWWRDHLAGAPYTLDLPRDRPRPVGQTFTGAEAHAWLDAGTTAGVRDLAGKLGATPAMTLGAAFGYLLGRLAGVTDVIFGTPTADRRHAAFADLVGFFIEVVPVRLPADHGATFTDQVRACRDAMLDALAHPAAPLERLVDVLGVPRDPSRAPLVQVLFNAYNFPDPTLSLPGLSVSPVPVAMPGSPFDLTVYVVERDGRFAVDVVYNPDLYAAARVDALLDGYVRLVEQCVAAPAEPMGQASLGPSPRPSTVESTVECVLDPVGRPAVVGEWGPVATDSGAGPVPTGEYGRFRLDGTVERALPQAAPPPAVAMRGDARALVGPTEHAVAAVWREVLGVPVVGPVDNFFEIGGTSMALVSVQLRLTEALGRPLSVVDLFRFANVRSLAAYLDGATDDTAVARATQRAALRRARRTARDARG